MTNHKVAEILACVGTHGTPPSPQHVLAMLTYFYLNELLVQTIRIPLGVPVGVPMVQRG